MCVQCVQSRNIKGKKKKKNHRGCNLEILSVSATESKRERNESCHFGHPPGLLVKGKIGPQRERDLFDSWLSHTLLNRRPIALSSLFCKCPKVKIITRRLQRIWTDRAKGVYSTDGHSECARRARTLLRASTLSRHTPQASSLAFLMPCLRTQEEKSRELSSGCAHTKQWRFIYILAASGFLCATVSEWKTASPLRWHKQAAEWINLYWPHQPLWSKHCISKRIRRRDQWHIDFNIRKWQRRIQQGFIVLSAALNGGLQHNGPVCALGPITQRQTSVCLFQSILTVSLANDMKPIRLFHTRLMSFRSCCSFSEHTAVALMPSSTRFVTRYTSTTPAGGTKVEESLKVSSVSVL